MCRLVKLIALFFLVLTLCACFAPAEPLPSSETHYPSETQERKKLWQDGVYARVKLNGQYNDVQCLVYDNYGDVVAQYYDFWEGNNIMLHEKSDLVLCYDYRGAFNLFSYEKLDYIMDSEFPVQAKLRLPGNHPEREWKTEIKNRVLEFIEDGEKHTYSLPSLDQSNDIYDINDTMVLCNRKLILYKDGKDISSLINGSEGDSASLNEGYAILQNWIPDDNKCKYTIIDRDGEILWQDISRTNFWYSEESNIKTDISGNILTIDNNGEKYEVDLGKYDSAEDIPVLGVNDQIVCQYKQGDEYIDTYHLFRYKTGEDISYLLDNSYVVEIYQEYILVRKERSDINPYDYAILDANANTLFTGNGHVGYEGYGLFSIIRGNYLGLINDKGEWLLRKLYINED